MRRLLVIAVVLGLLGASEAQATTIMPGNARWPYQRWIARAHVPTPDVTLSVSEDRSQAPCAIGPMSPACTDLETIWVRPAPRATAELAFLGTVGRIYDVDSLPESARATMDGLLGEPIVAPGLSDSIATVYAECAIHMHITEWWIEGIGIRKMKGLCAILR